MRNALIFFAFFFSPVVYGTNWVPPENPDPKAIRKEARIDAKEGRHEQALAKHVWYHDNALEIKPSLTGVRLSFALNGWLELAEVYPPALEKMKECRNELEKRIRDENRVRVSFEDYQTFNAFNRTLREQERTVDVFKWLDNTNIQDAERMYGVSENALIESEEYELCGKYIKSDKRLNRIARLYNFTMEHMQAPHQQFMVDSANRSLIKDASRTVAILVLNDRLNEANEVAEYFKELVKDEDVLKKLNRSLESAKEGKHSF